MTARKLTLRDAHWKTMLEHLRRHGKEEACGLLGGAQGRVERVWLIENVRHSPNEYYMNPEQQVRAMLEIEAAGWDVSGIFHSHPFGPPVPSDTDISQAYYPESVYVIVALSPDATWGLRGFQIEAGVAREIPIEIEA